MDPVEYVAIEQYVKIIATPDAVCEWDDAGSLRLSVPDRVRRDVVLATLVRMWPDIAIVIGATPT